MLSCGYTVADDAAAHFEIVADITWSSDTAPFEFPGSAHLSGLVGATHNTKYVLFRDGQTASSGLELIAENGRAKTLRSEFAEVMRRGRLGTIVDGPELSSVPGQITAST